MTYEKRFTLVEKRFTGAAANPPEVRFAVQITLTGEEAGIFYIANMDRGFEVAPYDYRDNTAAMTISGENLTKLLSGRLNPEKAAADGRIEVTGNMAHVQLIAKLADPPAARKRK